MNDQTPKFWLHSKQLMKEGLTIVAGLAVIVTPYAPQVQRLLGANIFGYVLLASGLAGAVIRQYTGGGLTTQPPPIDPQ